MFETLQIIEEKDLSTYLFARACLNEIGLKLKSNEIESPVQAAKLWPRDQIWQ